MSGCVRVWGVGASVDCLAVLIGRCGTFAQRAVVTLGVV